MSRNIKEEIVRAERIAGHFICIETDLNGQKIHSDDIAKDIAEILHHSIGDAVRNAFIALNSSNNGEDFGALVNLFAPHFDISV